jgi:hypothetical protein
MSWKMFRVFVPAPEIGAHIVQASLRRAAEEYASLLTEGSDILDDTDSRIVDPIRHLLPALLGRRGLVLAQIPGGWRVERAPFTPAPPPSWDDETRLACRGCGGLWMECGCPDTITFVEGPYEGWIPPIRSLFSSRKE